MRILKAYKQNQSVRGLFLGVVNFGSWEEVNYVETEANQVRGRHYHKEAKEVFFIIEGEIDIEVTTLAGKPIKEFTATKGSIFLIEPFEVHTFTCKSKSSWINMMSNRLIDGACDIYKV